MSGTAPYSTQAFSPLPGRCFRVVSGGEGGGPTHCPKPPVWRGARLVQVPPVRQAVGGPAAGQPWVRRY